MSIDSHFNHWLFWPSVITVALAQFGLCYEALVCRGYPPLSEMGMYKMWASPFLIWLPAIFGTRITRFLWIGGCVVPNRLSISDDFH